MRRAKKPAPADLTEKPSSEPPKTLEEKVRQLWSVSDEDAKEAILLIEKHPDDNEDFNHLANIMQEVVRGDQYQVARQLYLITRNCKTHLMDFLALIGGAKATVEVYTNQLKVLGVTFFPEKLFEENHEGEKGRALQILIKMRSFWVNATDLSMIFSARLAEAKLFPYLAEDIKNLDSKSNSVKYDIFDKSVTILHNSARNKQLRQYFRDISLVHLLTPFLARTDKDIKLLSLLTLSYIIDEQDNHLLLADDSDFDFLLDNVAQAWATQDHRNVSGYSLEELLQGLGNLVQNDDNKKLLMKKGVLTHLKPILKTGRDGEKQMAAKIVWELSFDNENKRLMKGDAELMSQLHKLKNSSHHGVAKSCSGALWVLDMDTKLKGGSASTRKPIAPPGPPPPPGRAGAPPPPPPASAPPKVQGHIMISYNWGNQKLMMQVRDSLRKEGFQVWMDIDNIKGSTLQAMAEAVEGASAVLICMSQRYKDSPNCRTEAEYAFALQKPIVPLLLERGYKPDGWLGMLKGSKLFFDFSGKYPYEKKVDELFKELGGYREKFDVEETDGPVVAEKAHPVASGNRTQDVSSWSQKDVNDWINKNQLHKRPKLQNLSGENIKFLQKLSHRAPEFYFTYLKQDLGLTSLNDLMHFSDAIDALP
ncbi:hypothetical protein V1264_001547 [Littorina saxatilis]|uniref:TIR domain-containing protein n=2 Tax=Littorina saxatilis TaxID=31220 RepID=A0AAN9GP60_9CAEN